MARPTHESERTTLVHSRPGDMTAPGESDVTVPTLVVLSGPKMGLRIPLGNGDTTIGRSRDADVQLSDESLSRLHAQVRWLPGDAYQIEDLGSRNGTLVNGQRLEVQQLLRPGDRIHLGPRVSLHYVLEEELEETSAEAEKMAAIGRLTAGITHDLNNVLTVLSANVGYVQDAIVQPSCDRAELTVCLDEMRIVTKRATEMIRRLSSFARGDQAQREPVDIAEMCEEIARFMGRVVPSRVTVETEITPDLPVEGNRVRLHQLLMNPCINARDAMPDGGRLRIEARMATREEVQELAEGAHGPHVLVLISDTGPGMDPETAKRAFRPFFTTKPDSAGTGLGLATVAKVAREHGGTVSLDSTRGKGVSVPILLPSLSRSKLAARATVDAPLSPSNADTSVPARVLLVDDEELLTRSASRVLRGRGHQVLVASNGAEALELFQRHRPDVVVVDLDMPQMDGTTCFRRVRELDPEACVLLMSGYNPSTADSELLAEGAVGLVPKPLDLRALSDRIHALRLT